MAGTIEERAVASKFPVSVIMERRRIIGNPWATEGWTALGVTVGRVAAAGGQNPVPLVSGPDATQFLWSGLTLQFFPDEAESYYHNLTVEVPGCYVVVRPQEDGTPEPILVTVSFDAAAAYQEGGETVYSVPLPPELYLAAEAFVLAHYVPEPRRKRKRDDWKGGGRGGQ